MSLELATRPAYSSEDFPRGRISLAAPRVPDLEIPETAPWRWSEPGREELEDSDEVNTEPSPPPSGGLDALRDAAIADKKLDFLRLGAELGLSRGILAALGDLINRTAP